MLGGRFMSIESEEFLSFSSKINEYISATMFGLEMNVESYNKKMIWEHIQSKGLKVRSFPFDGKARQSISGMIIKDSHETTIGYNSNMNAKRINFTISHEMVHYLYHFTEDTHYFTDTKKSLEYTLADQLLEFQANVGASAILIPDPVLVYELKNGLSMNSISEKYGISTSAIYIRLMQCMQGYFEANHYAASKTASKIVNGKAVYSMKELGNNLEKKIIYSNPFYEALCV